MQAVRLVSMKAPHAQLLMIEFAQVGSLRSYKLYLLYLRCLSTDCEKCPHSMYAVQPCHGGSEQRCIRKPQTTLSSIASTFLCCFGASFLQIQRILCSSLKKKHCQCFSMVGASYTAKYSIQSLSMHFSYNVSHMRTFVSTCITTIRSNTAILFFPFFVEDEHAPSL